MHMEKSGKGPTDAGKLLKTYELGVKYAFGEGVPKDWDKARELLLECWEEIPDAALHLGMMAFRGERKRPNQIGEGIFFLSEAAMRGVDEAFPEIIHWWHALDGHEDNWIAEKFQEELKEVTATLEREEDAQALDALGQFYLYGVYFDQDLAKAKDCFSRAAAKNPDEPYWQAVRHLNNPLLALLSENEDDEED